MLIKFRLFDRDKYGWCDIKARLIMLPELHCFLEKQNMIEFHEYTILPESYDLSIAHVKIWDEDIDNVDDVMLLIKWANECKSL